MDYKEVYNPENIPMIKSTYTVYMALILFLSAISMKIFVHHSYAAEFGSKNPVHIEGVVKEV